MSNMVDKKNLQQYFCPRVDQKSPIEFINDIILSRTLIQHLLPQSIDALKYKYSLFRKMKVGSLQELKLKPGTLFISSH